MKTIRLNRNSALLNEVKRDSILLDSCFEFQNINHSLDQLKPILYSLPVNAIFSDFAIAVKLAEISADLDIPYYIVATTSAQFFSLIAYLPFLTTEDPNVFSNPLETIAALNSYRVLNNLPPLFPIGPLRSREPQERHHLPWLNEKPAESVVYVNFGSREVMSTDQIRELRKGLEICGRNYLWVIKSNEEGHVSKEFHEFSGDSSPEGSKSRGEIIRGWVDQEKILAHPAIGGFVNQCEWGSVMQAAW
ncbi:UDP-glycosyltransferase 708C1-like [Sesamum indicum]|uniref:UDP-glycosyltransferase 708C1-like n=1 Tax=Sesamum indicum TaxID=4182 RepID=A0A6I9UCK3_SESIN|nr:UDP-glycosyltransferase 708C1-like [Sesamum indicum]